MCERKEERLIWNEEPREKSIIKWLDKIKVSYALLRKEKQKINNF